jgi:hypothetical protein
MNTITANHRISATVAGLVGLAAFLLAAPAQATRIPADPVAFIATPVLQTQLVTAGHAANVRAALADLLGDVAGQ